MAWWLLLYKKMKWFGSEVYRGECSVLYTDSRDTSARSEEEGGGCSHCTFWAGIACLKGRRVHLESMELAADHSLPISLGNSHLHIMSCYAKTRMTTSSKHCQQFHPEIVILGDIRHMWVPNRMETNGDE